MFTLGLLLLSCAAARTKNYTGAELKAVVSNAGSAAVYRNFFQVNMDEEIKLTMNDFLNALQEVIPDFGA